MTTSVGPEEIRWDRQETKGHFEALARVRALVEQHSNAAHELEYERLREALTVAHLNLVRFLASKFANRGEPLDDLIQVGMLGLIKAIDRYDLARGVEFTTYATPTIVGEIKRYFRDKGWAVKVPRRLQELNIAINRAMERLNLRLGRGPTVAELALQLKVSEEDILEAQELGQAYNLLSLDTELSDDLEGRHHTLADSLGQSDLGLQLFEDREHLARAFTYLSPRERVILYLRFYESVSQTEIAQRLNVSQMHVSRLQHRALEKLREILDKPD